MDDGAVQLRDEIKSCELFSCFEVLSGHFIRAR